MFFLPHSEASLPLWITSADSRSHCQEDVPGGCEALLSPGVSVALFNRQMKQQEGSNKQEGGRRGEVTACICFISPQTICANGNMYLKQAEFQFIQIGFYCCSFVQ